LARPRTRFNFAIQRGDGAVEGRHKRHERYAERATNLSQFEQIQSSRTQFVLRYARLGTVEPFRYIDLSKPLPLPQFAQQGQQYGLSLSVGA
jgi:hypothetical protein